MRFPSRWRQWRPETPGRSVSATFSLMQFSESTVNLFICTRMVPYKFWWTHCLSLQRCISRDNEHSRTLGTDTKIETLCVRCSTAEKNNLLLPFEFRQSSATNDENNSFGGWSYLDCHESRFESQWVVLRLLETIDFPRPCTWMTER